MNKTNTTNITKVLETINSNLSSNNSNGTNESIPFDLSLLTLSNPVFGNFMFWTAILALKMLLMAILTAIQRSKHKIFANPEDAEIMKVEVVFNNPDVERVRRAHRNDLENILPYFTIGLLYITIDPNPTLATILFRIATISRILHTFVYAIYPVRQPIRLICFLVQSSIAIFMG
ncbi:microsomal glutathione S-transferase 1-like, partial [Condylostylus longicornis]|uniref:microsomal glutathione S-transferase 1-like n=1 Tax=Condylostylus longicornis TaxID=2530218 RepID=UPI00244E3744